MPSGGCRPGLPQAARCGADADGWLLSQRWPAPFHRTLCRLLGASWRGLAGPVLRARSAPARALCWLCCETSELLPCPWPTPVACVLCPPKREAAGCSLGLPVRSQEPVLASDPTGRPGPGPPLLTPDPSLPSVCEGRMYRESSASMTSCSTPTHCPPQRTPRPPVPVPSTEPMSEGPCREVRMAP